MGYFQSSLRDGAYFNESYPTNELVGYFQYIPKGLDAILELGRLA